MPVGRTESRRKQQGVIVIVYLTIERSRSAESATRSADSAKRSPFFETRITNSFPTTKSNEHITALAIEQLRMGGQKEGRTGVRTQVPGILRTP